MWVYAADYFQVRRAHALQHLPDTERLEGATVNHLFWRYAQWYGRRDILATGAALLAEVLDRLLRRVHSPAAAGAVSSVEVNAAHVPDALFALYSGHDVTVLPLLLALLGPDWTLAHDGAIAAGRKTVSWPGYASSLRFELWQEGVQSEPGRRGPPDPAPFPIADARVRVVYNGEPIRIFGSDHVLCSLCYFEAFVKGIMESAPPDAPGKHGLLSL